MSIFDKMLRIMLKPWFIIVFFGLAVASYLYLDQDIALYFYSLHLRKNLIWFNWVTNIGSSKLYVALLPIIALTCGYVLHNKSMSLKVWMLWLFVFYPTLIAYFLKNICGRARPIVLFNHETFGFFGLRPENEFHSFPSGHTTTITSLAIGLLILFPNYFYYWATVCLLVILSRVLLTYHYLSDVLVSFYLVFLELGIFIYIMRRKFPKICELVLK